MVIKKIKRNHASGDHWPQAEEGRSGALGANRWGRALHRAWVAGLLLIFLLMATAAQAAVTVNKAFAPSTMSATGTSTITITLGNTGTSAASSAAFTDNLPSGLTVASPSNGATTCGGTVTATPGGNSFSLSGGTIPANGVTCTVTVSVTTSVTGNYTNTIPVGGLTTSLGNNGAAASATLAVITQQPITGSWALQSTNGGASYLKGNGPAYTYAVTLNNPNTFALTNASTTFTLPAQLVYASPSNLSTTCGGTLTSTVISGTLSGGTIPANGNCTIFFSVVAATPNVPVNGAFNISIPASNISTAQGITNAAAIVAGITVGSGAFIAKSLAPNPIISGGTSSLTLTFSYANAGSAIALNLTDTLPAGMTVAAIPNLSNTCGGVATALPATGTVQLSGGTLPAVAITASAFSTCTVKVDVTGVNNGALCTSPNVVLTNSIPAGNFSGVNYNAASAALTVTPARPLCGSGKSISNYFYAGSAIDVAGSVQTVTITLRNPLAIPDTVVSLTDNLTSPLTVAASPAPTTTCAGGVITAVPGSTSFSMLGGIIPASNGTTSGSCNVSVPVNVPLSAANTNISNTIPIGGITTVNGSNITAIGSGNVFVFSPLVTNKAFNPSQGIAGTISTLTINLSNGNGFTSGPALFPLTNITGSDTLPANMVVATPSALATTCTGATVSAAAGGNSINFSGVNLNVNTNCTITLKVQVSPTAPVGTLTNSIPSNTVTTNEGPRNTRVPTGGGGYSNGDATAGFQVVNSNVTINKTFSPANVPVGTPSTVNIQFINTNASNITLTGAALTDALPAGMTIANPATASFTGSGCGGAFTLTATPGASTATLSGAQINAGATCSLKFNVVANTAGNVVNTLPIGSLTSAQGISNSQATVATLAVSGTADLGITKTDNQTSMSTGTTSTYQIVVSNAGPHNVAGALVEDTPPPGMTFTNWTCAATAGASCGAASGSGAISDTANINVGSTVTYTVTAQIPVNYSGASVTNTATVSQPGSVVDANQANNTASDTDTVVSGVVFNLTKLKTPSPTTYTPGTTASYIVTAQNTGPANATQVNLFDTLPAGVTLTGTPSCIASGTASCGAITGAAGQNQFAAAGATLPSGGNGTLTYSLPVMFASSMTASTIVNTVSAVDVPSQGNATASTPNALLLPSADISVVKTGPATVLAGDAIQYTLLVSNAGPSDANGTTFNDAVPASVTGVAATCGSPTGGAVCPASVTVTGNTVSGTMASLPANSSATITVTGTVSSSNSGPITNTASVALPANITDPSNGNNTSTATTAVASVISLTKTADVTTLIPGGTVNYTVIVKNRGLATVSSIAVSDPVATGITTQSWTCVTSGGGTCTASGTGAVTDTIASLPAGATATYTITASVSNAPPASVTNTASSTPDGGGVCAPANTPAPCTAAVTLSSAPIIQVSKMANTTALVPGGTVQYIVKVRNNGASAASDVLITDPVAGGITSQSWTCAASGGAACPQASGTAGINQTIATMPSGGEVTYTITAVISNTPPTNVSNTAVAMPSESGTVCGPTNTPGPCSATASVPPLPQVSVVKSANATTVVAGGTIVYTIVVSNSGVMPANSTAVSDPIPAGIASQSWTCAASGGASCTASGTGAVTDTLVSFPAGSYATYTVTAQVSANPPATIGNTVVATPAAGTLCTPGNTASPCSASAAVSPDPQISVAKSVDAPTIAPGGVVHYTVSVTNNGSVAADGTTVSDPIPAGITSQSWTCAAQAGATCTASGTGAISDTLGTFPPGSFVTYTVTATVSSTPPASITNTASSTPPAGTCAPGNTAPPCQATASSTPLPQVQITKSASTSTLIPGGTVTYTVVVRNTSAVAANGTTVSDPVAAGITAQSWTCAAAGGASCTASGTGAVTDTLAAFPAGAAATYTITASVSNAPPATVTNTASSTPGGAGVCAPANTAAPCTASVTLGSAPIIEVTKSANTTALVPGGTVIYTVTVRNSGSVAADGTTVSDAVPVGIASQSWVCSATGGATCTASGNGTVSDTIATFPVGAVVTYTVTATVSSAPPATITNTASVTPSGGGVCGVDMKAAQAKAASVMAPPCTASVTGSSTPQLQISKTADLQTVAVGGTIEYTVTVINGGSVPADGTVISDPIPEGIASQLWTCRTSAGAVCAGIGSGAISDTITSLPVGGSVVYTVTAKVSFTAPKVITNVATITPPAGGNCTPCTASAATAVQRSSTPTPVPGLSQWGMGLLVLLMSLVSGIVMRRQFARAGQANKAA